MFIIVCTGFHLFQPRISLSRDQGSRRQTYEKPLSVPQLSVPSVSIVNIQEEKGQHNVPDEFDAECLAVDDFVDNYEGYNVHETLKYENISKSQV